MRQGLRGHVERPTDEWAQPLRLVAGLDRCVKPRGLTRPRPLGEWSLRSVPAAKIDARLRRRVSPR